VRFYESGISIQEAQTKSSELKYATVIPARLENIQKPNSHHQINRAKNRENLQGWNRLQKKDFQ